MSIAPPVKSIMLFAALILCCAGIVVGFKVHPFGVTLLVVAGYLMGMAFHCPTKKPFTMSDGRTIYLEP